MEKFEAAFQAPGVLHVKIQTVQLEFVLKRAFVTIKDSSDTEFKTSVSNEEGGNWHEGFEIPVSLHGALFGTLRIDLFESGVLFNKHIGRSTIRVLDILACSPEFTSWYELTTKRTALVGAAGSFHTHSTVSFGSGSGAIQVGFHFKSFPTEEAPVDVEEIDNDVSRAREASQDEEEENLFLRNAKEDAPQGFNVVDKLFFVSKETRTVLKAVRRIFTAYKQGFSYSNLSIFGGLAALESFYRTQTPYRTTNFITNLQFIQLATHFHRFAMAAYGWRGLNFFGKRNNLMSDAVRKKADCVAVTEFLKLEQGDLLLHAFGNSEIAQRSYFVAHDRLSSSVVLAIRGTMSHADTLIDLSCEYSKWRGGYVHSGIKASANWFYANVLPQCIALAKQKNVANFVLTGHSLGSGVASFLAMMIDGSRSTLGIPDAWNIEAFCFCPPCTVSPNLAGFDRLKIHSFVYDIDMVPRLSYGSMMDLKSLLVGLMDRADSTFLRNLSEILTGVAPEKQQQLYDTINHIRSNVFQTDRHAKLYVPGTIYQLYTVSQPQQSSEDLCKPDSRPQSPLIAPASAPQRTSSLHSSRAASPVSSSNSEDGRSELSAIKLEGPVSPRLDNPGAGPAVPDSKWTKFVEGKQVVMGLIDCKQIGELWISTEALYNHIPSVIDTALETLYNQTMHNNQLYHKRLDQHRHEMSIKKMTFVRGSLFL